MLQKSCIAVLVSLLALLGRHAMATEPIRIGTWNAQTDRTVMASSAVLQRAYGKLNQPIDWVDLPIRRALAMLLDDQLDANVHRSAAMCSAQPTLVQVPTPINAVTVRGYVRLGSNLHVAQWHDTEGMVATYLRGTLMVESKLPTATKPMAAASLNDMYRMVARNMADIAIVVEPAGSPPQALALSDGLIRLAPVLDQAPLYHCLSGRQRELAARLNTVLEKMSASGEMKEIQKRAVLAGAK